MRSSSSSAHQPLSDPVLAVYPAHSPLLNKSCNKLLAASTNTHLGKGIQINLRCHQQLSLISITFKQFIFVCILISVINRQQMLSCMVISVIPHVWRNCALRLYLVSLISEGKASNRMLISHTDLRKQSGTHKLRTQRCPSKKKKKSLQCAIVWIWAPNNVISPVMRHHFSERRCINIPCGSIK